MGDMQCKKGMERIAKKARTLIVAGTVSILAGSMWLQAQEFCPEDFYIVNHDFTEVDNAGLPVGWGMPKPETNLNVTVDQTTYHSAPGALKMWYDINGFGSGNALVSYTDMPTSILNTLEAQQDTVYMRAWVKTDNTPPHAFQIAIEQGTILSGPPWWRPKGWEVMSTTIGTNDWNQVTGKYVKKDSEVNEWNLRIQLRADFPCTAWVDDIEFSSDSQFCPPTSTTRKVPLVTNTNKSVSMRGSLLQFDRSTPYQVTVIAPNGRQIAVKSGYGKSTAICNAQIPSGFYIVSVQSDFGNKTFPYVVSGQM